MRSPQRLKVEHFKVVGRLFTISNLEHSCLIDCMGLLHPGASCTGIFKWAQRDQNDKRTNSMAASEAEFLSVYSLYSSTKVKRSILKEN